MLNKHITSLLNLEGIFVKKINHADNYLKIYIETKATTQWHEVYLSCPKTGIGESIIKIGSKPSVLA